jgi:hypothetical protein
MVWGSTFAAFANSTGSTMDGSSFSGLLSGVTFLKHLEELSKQDN